MTPAGRLSDTELNAYIDAELAAVERQSVEERLAADTVAAAKAAELQRLNEIIRTHYAPVLEEPLPDAMRALLDWAPQSATAAPWLRVAAAVLLLLAGGAAGFALREATAPAPAPAFGAALVDNAVSAHSVYAAEVRHPVEVRASEEEHLVKWLTKRVGANIRAPHLSNRGFKLLGGRLLPYEGGPAAQFMYENGGGRRLTIYVRQAGKAENTAFQFASHDKLSAFFWVDRPLAWVIVGELPRDELLSIARATYEQLQ